MEFEKLKKVIAEVLSVDPDEITMDTTFTDDLGADSLDVFQIIMGIEEEFDIEIPTEKAESITTVEEAVEMIVIVAAYNDNNGMISSFKSQTVTAGVGVTEVPYTLESTTGAKVYKAFCWNNLSDIAPYCKAAVYEVK